MQNTYANIRTSLLVNIERDQINPHSSCPCSCYETAHVTSSERENAPPRINGMDNASRAKRAGKSSASPARAAWRLRGAHLMMLHPTRHKEIHRLSLTMKKPAPASGLDRRELEAQKLSPTVLRRRRSAAPMDGNARPGVGFIVARSYGKWRAGQFERSRSLIIGPHLIKVKS